MEKDRMKSVVEEVFEIQKFRPLKGWFFVSASDRVGNTLPCEKINCTIHGQHKRRTKATNLNATARTSTTTADESSCYFPRDEQHMSCFPPHVGLGPDWIWSHDWIIDVGYTQCDEQGWCYASSISRLNTHLARGTSRVKKDLHHLYRRRRWIRTRVRKSHLTRGYEESDATSVEKEPTEYHFVKDSVLSHLFHARSAVLSTFTHLHFNERDVAKDGWLGKCGSFSKNWKLRFFILRRDTSSLVYLKDDKSMIQLGEIQIHGHTSVVSEPTDNPHQFHFVILNEDKEIRLNATDARIRTAWISEITKMIVQGRASFLEAAAEDDERSKETSRQSPPSNGMYPAMDEDCENRPTNTWRPYSIACACMNRKLKSVDAFYASLYYSMVDSNLTLVNTVCQSALRNISNLESSVRETVTRTSTQLSEPMLRELQSLTTEIIHTRSQLVERIERMKSGGVRSIFVANKFKRDLYLQAKQWLDSIVIHAQVTLRPAPRPAPKGRIPMDWLENVDATDDVSLPISQGDHSLVDALALSGRDMNDKAENTFERRHRISSAKINALALDNSMNIKPIKKASSSPKKLSMSPILAFNLPESLTDGHPELPAGFNDIVVFIKDEAIASIIAFVLGSQAYAQELQHERVLLDLFDGLGENDRLPGHTSHQDAVHFQKDMDTLSSNLNRHIDLDFQYESKHHKHHVRCITYFADQFHALRQRTYPGNLGFLESLSIAGRFDPAGGKSGADFSVTHDKRFILKEISLSEFNMFVHMAPSYFQYMAKVVKENLPTALSKILGIYKITRSGGLQKSTAYVIAMENILLGRKLETLQLYDLKGLVRRRFVDENSIPKDGSEKMRVLQDGNFMDCIPVPVLQSDLDVFNQAIENDTSFLCKSDVIDYSLFLTINEDHRQLVVGLIDYIHQYDFLKKMESTSKASITFQNPTIIGPVPYKKRFMDAMQRYFVGVLAPPVRRMSSQTPMIRSNKSSLLSTLESQSSTQSTLTARTTRTAAGAGAVPPPLAVTGDERNGPTPNPTTATVALSFYLNKEDNGKKRLSEIENLSSSDESSSSSIRTSLSATTEPDDIADGRGSTAMLAEAS